MSIEQQPSIVMRIVHPGTGEPYDVPLDQAKTQADYFRGWAKRYGEIADQLDRVASGQPRKRRRKVTEPPLDPRPGSTVEPQHDQGGVDGGQQAVPKTAARQKAEEALAETDKRLAEDKARRDAQEAEMGGLVTESPLTDEPSPDVIPGVDDDDPFAQAEKALEQAVDAE